MLIPSHQSVQAHRDKQSPVEERLTDVEQSAEINDDSNTERMDTACEDISGCDGSAKEVKEEVGSLPAHSVASVSMSGPAGAGKILDKSSVVQITASKEEIQRRISAFISHKRAEIDELNKGEFGCPDSDNSCARVNAVYVPKFGKSRLKVSRVYNTHGPQTHMTSGHSAVLGGGDMDSWMRAWEESLEERLGNVEHHLKLSRDSAHDYLGRIKAVEERVLFLEGLSPEYFLGGPPPPKRRRLAATVPFSGHSTEIPVGIKEKYQNWTLVDIDQRIHELRRSLQQKSRKEI
ncbi:MAP3K12-binding inhibitory protein 1-like isoform X2 [Pomacea canaliculata]|uniref:MAP3K12-binding inhibitory protein 1-like isoform X2 n=1 Tax=Pomacea canaliculata TaxID=400727 RepID=UPI000D73B496|nr:MAP3K12-binding inhibitory protein 1-like isoform X2 [Pomacea canaliculata]